MTGQAAFAKLLRMPRSFRDNTSGLAVTEFALIAPLLIMFMGVVFEVGRGWLEYQNFVSTVDNTARWAARFPAFEARVRTGIPSYISRSTARIDTKTLDLTLRSASKSASGVVLAFSAYNFYGNTSDVNWSTVLDSENFKIGEVAVVITGRYWYKPFFAIFGNYSIKFEYGVAINPFFSRSYNYLTGDSDWKYYNVR